jgi:hypothetical protein
MWDIILTSALTTKLYDVLLLISTADENFHHGLQSPASLAAFRSTSTFKISFQSSRVHGFYVELKILDLIFCFNKMVMD